MRLNRALHRPDKLRENETFFIYGKTQAVHNWNKITNSTRISPEMVALIRTLSITATVMLKLLEKTL
jgi:hypothetical protein